MAERFNRSIVGSIMLLLVMSTEQLPPWVALVAAYIILTAICAWDPFYLVFSRARQMLHRTRKDKPILHKPHKPKVLLSN
jgi:hypothetical protein